MPQRGQDFFTSQLGAQLDEHEVLGVRSQNGEQFVAIDDLPQHMKADQASFSIGEPVDAIETDNLRKNLRPERIHQARSAKARRTDQRRDAKVTTDELKWASSPDEYDFPGVDTGPMFEDTFGDRNPETLQRRDEPFFDF